MPKSNIKKLSIIVTREALEQFLDSFLILGYAEVSEAPDLPDSSDLHPFVKREFIDLSSFICSDKDVLCVLGTKYTVFLTGWIPLRYESELISVCTECGCAWDISAPVASEIDFAPVELRFPWFFGKYRLAGRRSFSPLTVIKKISSELEGSEGDSAI